MKNYPVITALACLIFTFSRAIGQSPVNTISSVSNVVVQDGTLTQMVKSHANSVNLVLPSTNYTLKYNNNGNVNIVDFTLTGKTYVRFSNFDTVIVRRAANTWETTGGNKQHIYVEGPAVIDNLTYTINFPAAHPQVAAYNYMERVMKEGYINRGSDNVFNNDSASDRTYNNIERVDFVDKVGVATTHITSAGFLIAERGGNDPFKIAAITGIDIDGNPTSFGPVLSVGTSSYGTAIISAATYVMRKDPADNELRPFSLVPVQNIRSVFIKLSDLGVTSMQRVYGYALMGNDVTATTSAQLLNYTNTAYFPRTTTTTNGGIDLASAPGIFHTDLVLEAHSLTLDIQNKNCQQLLQWQDNDYAQAERYNVEKSLDKENFKVIASINSSQKPNYSFTDADFSGPCYYRVKTILLSGVEYYSPLIFANNSCASSVRIKIFPNPAKDVLSLNFDAGVRIKQVTIFSLTGKEMGKWAVNENSRQLDIDISGMSPGQYYMKIADANGIQKSNSFIKL